MTLRVGSAKTTASTLGMSTPSEMSFAFVRIARPAAAKAAKMAARSSGVWSPWTKNRAGSRSGHRSEVGGVAPEQAQGAAELAGEACGVLDEVEVHQHSAQAVLCHGLQDGQMQRGGPRCTVPESPMGGAGVPGRGIGGARRGRVEYGAEVGVGDLGDHEPVVRGSAVRDGGCQGVLEDLPAVDGLVVHRVRGRVGRLGGRVVAARGDPAGGLRHLGGGEAAWGRGHVEPAIRVDGRGVVDDRPLLVRAARNPVRLVHDRQVERRHRAAGVLGVADLVQEVVGAHHGEKRDPVRARADHRQQRREHGRAAGRADLRGRQLRVAGGVPRGDDDQVARVAVRPPRQRRLRRQVQRGDDHQDQAGA